MRTIEAPTNAENVSEEFAKGKIESIRAEIAAMGANDSEFHNLDEILHGMAAGSISPAEAVAEAEALEANKNDYH